MSRILAFSGSSRKESFNGKLLNIAIQGARQSGADVTLVNLAELDLPIYHQDFEAEHGLPDNARKLKELFIANDALLIASPEYNSAFSPLLKNSLDWASRAESDSEPPLSAYQGKSAVIMAASPGGLGGLRGLVHLRMLLGNLGVLVLPDQVAVPQAFNAFADDGNLLDPKRQASIESLGAKLHQFVSVQTPTTT